MTTNNPNHQAHGFTVGLRKTLEIKTELFKGDICHAGDIVFTRSCNVIGHIRAIGGVCCNGDLTVGEDIRAGNNIEVIGNISAGGPISSGELMACEEIESGEYVFSFPYRIHAKSIKTKTLPFWREYWADAPPLKKWRKDILAPSRCWDDLRKLPTKAEAEKICRWGGWHWIIRAQLEMFFGLKDVVEIAPTRFVPPRNEHPLKEGDTIPMVGGEG